MVSFPHNDLINTRLRHRSNSSSPLLKRQAHDTTTHNQHSSKVNSRILPLLYPNQLHITNSSCLETHPSETRPSTRLTTSAPSATRLSKSRRRRTASTRARTTHTRPTTPRTSAPSRTSSSAKRSARTRTRTCLSMSSAASKTPLCPHAHTATSPARERRLTSRFGKKRRLSSSARARLRYPTAQVCEHLMSIKIS
ncbi:hypothetical protein SNOG_08834 [Parastagonospora nodorum SN15]|uniref:Uncharacterized protein n=1 Tax=Phaeosphaeria nodorum (strain SN15 / ATCC MYA-4574 / FGSC 10173) TaxID=321614 RepID=Q0UHD0_PHANO|nr:hypothetical protein SNOG_08834 [Parastagonospora nodorum SN15]EAT84002.2 hypothetical protein SNOG_08834 [Parastagonospora nodorum SN15]